MSCKQSTLSDVAPRQPSTTLGVSVAKDDVLRYRVHSRRAPGGHPAVHAALGEALQNELDGDEAMAERLDGLK
jgi:hypothetical protein